MRPIVLSLLFLLSAFNLYSQNSDWVYHNPLPQNDFYAIKFFDQNTGYVCGSGGVILKNTTGSNNWVTQNSGTTNNLYSMFFTDLNHGVIVGSHGTILLTTNSGVNWLQVSSGTNYTLRSVYFVNASTGFIVSDTGKFLSTTNGGSAWNLSTISSNNFNSVKFYNINTGVAVGNGVIAKTTNLGLSWSIQNFTGTIFRSVCFTDSLNGYVVGSSPITNFRTTNGGANWVQMSFSNSQMKSISFANTSTGFAAGPVSPIFRTTNQGISWAQWCSGQLFASSSIQDLCPIDTNTVFLCGYGGLILKCVGNYQSEISYHLGGTRSYLMSTSFINENTGCVVGDGQYVYTTNSGLTWSVNCVGQNSWFEYSKNIRAVYFFQPLSGYRAYEIPGIGGGGSYSIDNTTDGGLTWNGSRAISSAPGTFAGICEAEGVTYLSSIGYYTGPVILKNSGSGWSTVLSTTYGLGLISFANQNTGAVIGGGQGQGLLRTTNGGTNWSFTSSGNTIRIIGIQFLPSGIAYRSGDSSLFARSTDFGSTWMQQLPQGNIYFYKMQFVNDNTGWLMGQSYNPYITRLYYTNNGGSNLVPVQSLGNFSIVGFSFVNSLTGYVCGDTGTVLKTTNGGLTFVNTINNSIPNSYSLSQNYPNPFNPSTTIKFDIPTPLSPPFQKGGNGRSPGGLVRLLIYDILGREVTTLINEQLQPGSYSINWDASNYPSGVYFYKLESGDFNASKKLVLIK